MNGISGYSDYSAYSSYQDMDAVVKQSAMDGLLHEIEHDGSESVKKMKEARQEIESQNQL